VQLGMDLRRGVWLKILASLHDEYIYNIFNPRVVYLEGLEMVWNILQNHIEHIEHAVL
jgi:hypothetical protein